MTARPHDKRPGRSSSQLCRPTTRARIYARDGHACVWCGRAVGRSALGLASDASLDHFVPRSLGGSNRYWNLITACRGCNSARRDTPAGEFALRFGRTEARRITHRIVMALSAPLPVLRAFADDRALELSA